MKRLYIVAGIIAILFALPVKVEAYNTKHVHNITYFARYIYLTGQEVGNNPYVLAKIGDSITYAHEYLWPIGEGRYNTGDYPELQTTIDLWGQSFTRDSIAAKSGFTLNDLLSPDPDCEATTRLDCEYQYVRPSVALIMIGTNDLVVTNDIDYLANQYRQVLNITLYYNVVPVLSTIPPSTHYDVTDYNQMVINLAYEYGIPYIDYYSYMMSIPVPLCSDGAHPESPPDGQTAYFDEWHLEYGYTMRNWLTLQMLNTLTDNVMY